VCSEGVREREVRFPGGGPGIGLAGTLVVPDAGPSAGVVLVSGSGANDRDETVAGHRTFRVLADGLARHGIAVLRYDDRGVGGSNGDSDDTSLADAVADATAAVRFLRTEPGVDPARVGLVGHSEGGLVAATVAAEGAVAFVVMLAGPGLPGEEVIHLQGELISRVRGASKEAIGRERRMNERVFAAVRGGQDREQAAEAAATVLREELSSWPECRELSRQELADAVQHMAAVVSTAAFRSFLDADPRTVLTQVSCPILAVGGELDLQAPPPNLQAIAAALRDGGNNRHAAVQLPGMNHLFQLASTGALDEYEDLSAVMEAPVPFLVATWVRGTMC
jgi:uncharacterized protein